MKRHSFKGGLVFCSMIFLSVLSTKAQTDNINIVTTAVPFLRINPDARGGGMGDVGIANSADVNSSFWNLAKTPFNKNYSGIGVTYTPWLKDLGLSDVYLASLNGFHKLDDVQAISASVRYFSLGNIQFTDFAGNPLGSFKPKEFAIDLGYSRKLSEQLSIGVAFRYINSSLANGDPNNSGVIYKAGTSIAADASVYYNGADAEGQGWSFGAALTNLGGKIGYTNDSRNKDFIPANLGLGVSYTNVFDEDSKISFSLDINKLLVPAAPTVVNIASIDSVNLANYRSMSVFNSYGKSFGDGSNQLKSLQASVGAEYSYANQFMVRAGYYFEDASRGNRKYFSVGVGLKYSIIGINFSYLVPGGSGVTRNPLSNTLRLGLNFDLDKD
jgi:hypothetical protein